MRILFIDDRPEEIERLWEESGLARTDTMRLEKPSSISYHLLGLKDSSPDVLTVGSHLGGSFTGSDLVTAAREAGYAGYVILNSGGGRGAFSVELVSDPANLSADRDATKLAECLRQIKAGKIPAAQSLYAEKMAWAEARSGGGSRPPELAESAVVAALESGDEAALNSVLAEFESLGGDPGKMLEWGGTTHEVWVHSLSHFIAKLWQLRKTEWLGCLYRLAVANSRATGCWSCMDRLVRYFADLSLWGDDPAEYGLVFCGSEEEQVLRQTEREKLSPRLQPGGFVTQDDWAEWYISRK